MRRIVFFSISSRQSRALIALPRSPASLPSSFWMVR